MQDRAMKVIRFRELVKKLGGGSRSSVDRWEKDGDFPKRIKLGPNSMGWYECEVDAWLKKRDKGLRTVWVKQPRVKKIQLPESEGG